MRSLLALAGLTIRAAVRTRALPMVALLLLALVGLLPLQLRDDGTAVGRLTVLIALPLSLAQALLCLTTVWLAAEAVGRELESRTIDLVATKPIARWRVLVGKWLGLQALNGLLLLVVGGACLLWVAGTARSSRWAAAEREAALAAVLSARREHQATAPDFEAAADRALAAEVRAGRVAAGEAATARRHLRQVEVARWQSLRPAGARSWEFRDVAPPQSVGELSLRFRLRASGFLPDDRAPGAFTIGEGPDARLVEGPFPVGQFVTVPVPAELVQAGTLRVSFRSAADVGLAFPRADGPTVRYRVGGFGGNALRALLLCWLQLGFLGALGLTAGSLLSWPVAAFVTLSYLVVAAHVPLVSGQLAEGALLAGHHGEAVYAPWVVTAAEAMVRFGLWMTSALHAWWPFARLAGGLLIGWAEVGRAVWSLGVVQTGLVGAVGLVWWSRRELAAGGDR